MAKVLLFCVDKIGQSMAGPAIRYWEMAKSLSFGHDVTLMCLNKPDVSSDSFKIITASEVSVSEVIRASDVMVAQTFTPSLAWQAKRGGVKLILDAYDPMPMENLEIFRKEPMAVRIRKHESISRQFCFDFRMSDAVICSNQHQHDLWMGLLLALGKITPALYDSMPSLDGLLSVVPFGLSSTPPTKSGPGLRERFNIPASSKVLLWGGGIWNWFDPITLLHAMSHIRKERQDVHLVFMGIKHPNEAIPEMEMSREAIALAKKLDLLDNCVHINYGWVPYEERQNFLLEADFGVSCHFDNLETQYSFRTRMLDYLWAGLPIIATEGDCFAEMVTSKNLGLVVPFQDSVRLANAITTLCDQPSLAQDMRKNIAAIRPAFEWNNVVAPLDAMIQRLAKQRSKVTIFQTGQVIAEAWRTHGPARVINYGLSRLLKLFAKPKKA